ncbi:MAG: 50S ribosomal protein L24 [Chloroflexi bacterium]|nr:50S ribosomal protein L24 [Chloroflexota bacterium]
MATKTETPKYKIKRGDTVLVVRGNDKGVEGRVLYVYPKKERVVVERVNVRKKHQRRAPGANTQTGIIQFEAPIHISNVMVVCPSCGEATRVGIRRDEELGRIRVCKKCGEDID